MNEEAIVAIRRDGEVICRSCIIDSVELAVWNDSADSKGLMEDHNISVIRRKEASGTIKCGRCGRKIELPKQ